MKINVKQILNDIQKQLQTSFEARDAQLMAQWLIEDLLSVTTEKIILDAAVEVSELQQNQLEDAIRRLKMHEPIQYVLGKASFYGLDFKVTPAVLIPRPETEELIDVVLQNLDNSMPLSILDVGTGSGCIAITLAKKLPRARVYGLDTEEGALAVARENALLHQASISWIMADFLKADLHIEALDVLVSNPPYVTEEEKKVMQPNVLDYEPGAALFVPDSDPLVFYRTIASRGHALLKTGGKVFCEINEFLGPETIALFVNAGYQQVQLLKDMQGKDRVVSAVKV